ncbi:Mrp/NBP35 family ATP-binding protein [Cellulosilyticum lentocellum]|uniref:Iron-sulfur cluster carrier protein n=1 Tax=Cellulosilyticum lentocellum (strain ATCC 49066 / DSM 5427 / NCIMB 11756 / RHM5) TaxID=642492 RepID=F2JJM9_CELLD|nr:Mrp/NBP35 family ATP-binding protein [Cellulosilyticum lentocellum]ADZ82071.1 ATPase-like, ParA/MinD [Cellulosilyticum lentocellum DSM 5427]
MSEGCTSGSCGSCSESCSSRKSGPKSLLEKPHQLSNIKKVIGVVSGKGGVGKSSITARLAISMNRKGYHSAVLDADITGPSIPKLFGINQKAYATEEGLYPVPTKNGIDIMSINLLLDKPTDPVVWRGPVIAGAVKQFWQEVIWQDVDYMFVDMPPGTGDVALTVFQSIPLDGIIIVTSPQDLVSMIVSKAVKMAQMLNIPIIGIVENYSYFKCPDCDNKHFIFGESKIGQVAAEQGIEVLAQLPIDPAFATLCDKGQVEEVKEDLVSSVAERIVTFCNK